MTFISRSIRTVLTVIDGEADAPTQRTRFAICMNCPFIQFNSNSGATCGKYLAPTDKTCGCVIQDKIRVASQKCPQGKW